MVRSGDHRMSLDELRERTVAQHRVENGVVIAGTGLVQGLISLAIGRVDAVTAGFAAIAIAVGGRLIVAGRRRLRATPRRGDSGGPRPTGGLPPARLVT